MRHVAAVSLIALASVSCIEQSISTDPPGSEGPEFAIMDGSQFGGNGHFFWLAPLVPQPKSSDFNGPFDPYVQPSIEICRLDDVSFECDGGGIIERFEFATGEIEIEEGAEHYHVGWDLPNSLRSGRFRIHALVGSSPDNILKVFGYRDIQIGGTGGADADFYGVNRGSTVPIKFRVEEGAICYGEEAGCATGTVTSGAGGFTTGFDDAGVFFEQNTVDDGVLVTVRFSLIEGEECVAFQNPYRPLDLAHYPDCWKVSTFPEDYKPLLRQPLTFGICYEHDGRMISEEQEGHARLYRAEDDGSAIQVMDLVTVPQLNCEDLGYGLEETGVLNYARDFLKRALQPVMPTPLVATSAARHAGLGGRGFASTIGFYMPASLAPADGQTDLGVVPVGGAVDVAALVMDGGDGFGGESLPVMNSRVWFSPDAGSVFEGSAGSTAVISHGTPLDSTDERNGIADGTWTIATPGVHTLSVSGVGYADQPLLGGTIPPETDGLPVWMDPVSRQPNGFEFTVHACDVPDSEVAAVDGEVKDGEYTWSEPFSASLSGDPAAAANLYIRNDCENLYLGMTVERDGDEKINTWRIDLDGDANGRSAGDDVVIVDVVDGLALVRDLWLTASCVNRKQASCGGEDLDSLTDKGAVFATGADGHWTYELVIPLSNGSEQDLNVAVGTGAVVGVSITLQLGNGAQGNSQVPGFKEYFDYSIIP